MGNGTIISKKGCYHRTTCHQEAFTSNTNEECFMEIEINGKVGGKLQPPRSYHLSSVTIVIRDCNYKDNYCHNTGNTEKAASIINRSFTGVWRTIGGLTVIMPPL